MQNQEYFTLKDVAEKYGVHVVTVRRWVCGGDLHARKIGKKSYYVTQEDLDKFDEKNNIA